MAVNALACQNGHSSQEHGLKHFLIPFCSLFDTEQCFTHDTIPPKRSFPAEQTQRTKWHVLLLTSTS